MPNTPGGLPYPLPTDPLTDGANAIKALALGVDGQLGARHSVRARNAVGQNLTDSVAVAATFEAEDWDTDALHDPAFPTRIAIPANLLGVWLFNFAVELPNPGQAHTAVCWLRKNGATFVAGSSHFGSWGPSNHVLASFAELELVTAAAYYEAMLTYQSGAARVTISMSFAASRLSV